MTHPVIKPFHLRRQLLPGHTFRLPLSGLHKDGDSSQWGPQTRDDTLAFHPKLSVPYSPPPLPDILRKFNRNLTGYAVGTGNASDSNAFLNQAVPGAKAEYGIWGCGVGSGRHVVALKIVILTSCAMGTFIHLQQCFERLSAALAL